MPEDTFRPTEIGRAGAVPRRKVGRHEKWVNPTAMTVLAIIIVWQPVKHWLIDFLNRTGWLPIAAVALTVMVIALLKVGHDAANK